MPSSILLWRRKPGRVDEDELPPVVAHRRVDRVARRAGDLRHDEPLLAEQPVDERRLADVRPADHRDAERGFLSPARAAGSCATSASSRSPEPLPLIADTGNSSPTPSV